VAVTDKSVPEDFLEKLFEVDGINVETGLRYASGIPEVYYESIKVFFEKIIHECAIMDSALAQGDLKTFDITIHAVKSMLKTIGMIELSDSAHLLEVAAKEGNSDYCHIEYPDFRDELDFLYDDLAVLFPIKAFSDAVKETGSTKFLLVKLEKAMAACSEFENEAAMAFLDELQVYDFGNETNKLISEAKSYLKDFNIDQAEAKLKKIVMEVL